MYFIVNLLHKYMLNWKNDSQVSWKQSQAFRIFDDYNKNQQILLVKQFYRNAKLVWSKQTGLTTTKMTKKNCFQVGTPTKYKNLHWRRRRWNMFTGKNTSKTCTDQKCHELQSDALRVAATEARRLSVMNRFMHAFVLSPHHHNRTRTSVILECEQHSLFSAVEPIWAPQWAAQVSVTIQYIREM